MAGSCETVSTPVERRGRGMYDQEMDDLSICIVVAHWSPDLDSSQDLSPFFAELGLGSFGILLQVKFHS